MCLLLFLSLFSLLHHHSPSTFYPVLPLSHPALLPFSPLLLSLSPPSFLFPLSLSYSFPSPLSYPLPLLFTQILAVYNTIGTVIRGHPTKLTDVIDYVVFERPLTKSDSRWRIAAKLPPQLPLKSARSEQKRQKALPA